LEIDGWRRLLAVPEPEAFGTAGMKGVGPGADPVRVEDDSVETRG
jgi:hypothetical protein